MGIDFNVQPGPGLLVGAEPEWQLAAQKVAQGDMFRNGLPTTDGTPNGPLDLAAMARIAYRNGALDQGGGLLSAALAQQQMKAAQAPSDVLGQSGSSAAGPSPTSSSTGSAMPLFRNALASVESDGSGGYSAQGPVTKTGDRAYGRYQVMGANIPAWTKAILGTEMTPEQFLADPKAQDAVFDGKFGQYLKTTGNPRDASSMWFSGHTLADGGADRADQLGTTGNAYVEKFMTALRSGAAARGIQAPSTDASSNPQTPAPVQVAQNGTSDAPAPSSTHPYGVVSTPASTPPPMDASSIPSAPSSNGLPAPVISPSSPSSTSKPATPYASNGSNFVDPTLGGLVTQEQLQKYGSYGGVAKQAIREAADLGNNPFAKTRVEGLIDYAKQIMSSVSKAQELTSAQKDARDPLVLQQEIQRDTFRAKARADAALDTALTPVTQPDGTVTLMPKRVAMAQAASGNGPVQSLPGYVTSGQQNLLTKLNDGSAAYAERQVASERLDALSDLLSTFQTGANTSAFGDAKARLASIGIPIPASAMKDVASMQQFTKDAYANVLSSMKDLGNRQYAAEVQSAVNSNPNVELQPAANAAMIAQMKAIKNYHDANFQDYANWYDANKGASNDAQFQIAWVKKNPLSTYVTNAAKDIAPMGVPLPPANKLVDGQAYMVQGSSGPVKARWSAAASHFIPVGR